MEIHSATKFEIEKAVFPLNHDCILKVIYKPGLGVSYEYFTCRAQDSGTISLILSKSIFVSKVYTSSVDNFNL